MLTCTGPISRNHAVGERVGQGATLAEALAGRETIAEGVGNAANALALAKRVGVEMPIVAAVHRVLFEGQDARFAMLTLMGRELRTELDQ